MEPKIDEICFELRGATLELATKTKALMDHSDLTGKPNSEKGYSEMRANIMIAYRHFEDARMRLGKVVQAFDGGTSCYPKEGV